MVIETVWTTVANTTSTMMSADVSGATGGILLVAFVMAVILGSVASVDFLKKLLTIKSAGKSFVWNLIIGGSVFGIGFVVYSIGNFAGEVIRPVPSSIWINGSGLIIGLWVMGKFARYLSAKLEKNLEKAKKK